MPGQPARAPAQVVHRRRRRRRPRRPRTGAASAASNHSGASTAGIVRVAPNRAGSGRRRDTLAVIPRTDRTPSLCESATAGRHGDVRTGVRGWALSSGAAHTGREAADRHDARDRSRVTGRTNEEIVADIADAPSAPNGSTNGAGTGTSSEITGMESPRQLADAMPLVERAFVFVDLCGFTEFMATERRARGHRRAERVPQPDPRHRDPARRADRVVARRRRHVDRHSRSARRSPPRPSSSRATTRTRSRCAAASPTAGRCCSTVTTTSAGR